MFIIGSDPLNCTGSITLCPECTNPDAEFTNRNSSEENPAGYLLEPLDEQLATILSKFNDYRFKICPDQRQRIIAGIDMFSLLRGVFIYAGSNVFEGESL